MTYVLKAHGISSNRWNALLDVTFSFIIHLFEFTFYSTSIMPVSIRFYFLPKAAKIPVIPQSLLPHLDTAYYYIQKHIYTTTILTYISSPFSLIPKQTQKNVYRLYCSVQAIVSEGGSTPTLQSLCPSTFSFIIYLFESTFILPVSMYLSDPIPFQKL